MGRKRKNQRRHRAGKDSSTRSSLGTPKGSRPAQAPKHQKVANRDSGPITVGRVPKPARSGNVERDQPVWAGPIQTKPPRKHKAGFSSRTAAFSQGGDLPSSVLLGSGGNYYSPQLSTDFLQLPQSQEELRMFYNYFYENQPTVGQAVDLRTEMLLSKVRFRRPEAKNQDLANAAMRFCERWADRIRLLERLLVITHELTLYGGSFVFVEDATPDMPQDVTYETVMVPDPEGNLQEKQVKRADATDREVAWLKRNYRGWTDILTYPSDRIVMEAYPFTNYRTFELTPDESAKELIDKASQGDERAQKIVSTMPQDIVDRILSGESIQLNTDPYAGSFITYLARKKSDSQLYGTSILQRCLRDLIQLDKYRQTQSQISDRHMTPYRIVWAPDLSLADIDSLRDQVDQALQDPDYSIVTNFEVHWEERGGGAENRLLELTSEYERIDRHLYAGLGVTESLLSGESSYSGDRINLEVINWRDMLRREQLQNFVDFQVLEPMCARMGFVEEDEDGNLQTIFPRLSFTRIGIRDHQESFDALFNLYQKGSLSLDTILDLLGIDPEAEKQRVKRDLLTVNDPIFNEVVRGIYNGAGQKIVDGSNVTDRIANSLGIRMVQAEPDPAMSRFASCKPTKPIPST